MQIPTYLKEYTVKTKKSWREHLFRGIAVMSAAVLALSAVFFLFPVHGEARIYDDFLRLHVLANSDSEADQAVKLEVRDAVLAYITPLLRGCPDRDGAKAVVEANLSQIKAAAEDIYGCDSVSVSLTYELYPVRQYEELSVPAGTYLSLRVMLGSAEGRNWWCVLFPPICLSASTAKDELAAAGYSDDQVKVMTDSGKVQYTVRFKLLELWEKWFGKK